MNNIIHPFVELHSIEEVNKFMNTSDTYIENNEFIGLRNNTNISLLVHPDDDFESANRLIGFFSDTEEYSQEYTKFLQNCDKISHRSDLRIGLVKDVEIIKHFKTIYDGIWFNSHSMNSLALKRGEKSMFLDLSLTNEMLDNFMLYNTISLIDELSFNNNKLIARVTTPVVIFFIDTVFHLENFKLHLKLLEQVGKKYLGYYVFMYVDGNVKTTAKAKLGFSKDSRYIT